MILNVKFLVIMILIILNSFLAYTVGKNFFLLSTDSNGNNILHFANGEEKIGEAIDADNDPITSNNRLSLISTSDKVEGTVIVTKRVINENGGSSKPSDFTINVHGNNPSPTSFPGNSSGTVVKLDMGMYSITESGPPNYNSTFSMDCAGAVMSVKTLRCDLTNTYINSIIEDS